MTSNGCPGGASGSTPELEKRNQHDKRCYFALVFPVSILDGILGQILSESASERHGLKGVWTAQARADRIWAVVGKSHPRGNFLHDFDVLSGARRSHLGDLFRKKWSSVAGGFGLVFGVMETVGTRRNPPEPSPDLSRVRRQRLSKRQSI